MTGVFIRREETHREDSHVMMEAEREMTHLYKPRITSKYQELEEAKKGSPQVSEGYGPAHTFISDFWPPSLREISVLSHPDV